jgi:hypothetical protein
MGGKVKLEQEIQKEKQKLDDIVSAIGAGLSLIDKDMRIVWINMITAEWFGDIEEIGGTFCYNTYPKRTEIVRAALLLNPLKQEKSRGACSLDLQPQERKGGMIS